MPTWSLIYFQDSNSPGMEQLSFFNDYSMLIIMMITLSTLYMMTSPYINSSFNKFMNENQEMETVWTLIPALILVALAVPSVKVLYLMEEQTEIFMSMKVSAHQWYWSSENTLSKENELNMFMVPSKYSRLLKTGSSMIIPVNTQIRMLVTSTDVIHAWTVPSLGLKVDAVPGRLNQTLFSIKRPSIILGQCSEICGVNHSFMPISIISLKMESILNN